VVPGQDYTLSVMLRVEVDLDEGDTLAVLSGDSAILIGGQRITIPTPLTDNNYELSTVEFNSGRSDEVTIQFVGGDLRIDDAVLDGPFPSDYVDPNQLFDWTIWEREGESPFVGTTMVYDPIDQFVVTPNGNGARHEAKVMTSERQAITDQYERFTANLTPELSAGAETIVVQWHPTGLATHKRYVYNRCGSFSTCAL